MDKYSFAIVISSTLVIASLSFSPAEARKWTITQRQQALSREIESAFRANQLTVKESKDLRDDMNEIADKEKKMKEKNDGRLSYKNNTEMEKDLNKVSNKLHKKILDKRVQ